MSTDIYQNEEKARVTFVKTYLPNYSFNQNIDDIVNLINEEDADNQEIDKNANLFSLNFLYNEFNDFNTLNVQRKNRNEIVSNIYLSHQSLYSSILQVLDKTDLTTYKNLDYNKKNKFLESKYLKYQKFIFCLHEKDENITFSLSKNVFETFDNLQRSENSSLPMFTTMIDMKMFRRITENEKENITVINKLQAFLKVYEYLFLNSQRKLLLESFTVVNEKSGLNILRSDNWTFKILFYLCFKSYFDTAYKELLEIFFSKNLQGGGKRIFSDCVYMFFNELFKKEQELPNVKNKSADLVYGVFCRFYSSIYIYDIVDTLKNTNSKRFVDILINLFTNNKVDILSQIYKKELYDFTILKNIKARKTTSVENQKKFLLHKCFYLIEKNFKKHNSSKFYKINVNHTSYYKIVQIISRIKLKLLDTSLRPKDRAALLQILLQIATGCRFKEIFTSVFFLHSQPLEEVNLFLNESNENETKDNELLSNTNKFKNGSYQSLHSLNNQFLEKKDDFQMLNIDEVVEITKKDVNNSLEYIKAFNETEIDSSSSNENQFEDLL